MTSRDPASGTPTSAPTTAPVTPPVTGRRGLITGAAALAAAGYVGTAAPPRPHPTPAGSRAGGCA